MAFIGLRRIDVMSHRTNDGDLAGLRWQLLFAASGQWPAIHIRPAGVHASSAWADGTPKPVLPTLIDANTPITDDMDFPPLGFYHGSADDGHRPGIQGQEDSGNLAILHTASFAWQMRDVHESPITESAPVDSPGQGNAASPGTLETVTGTDIDPHDLFTDQSQGNLSMAFLPPDAHDAPLIGFDAGMLLMPPPLPPPPEMV